MNQFLLIIAIATVGIFTLPTESRKRPRYKPTKIESDENWSPEMLNRNTTIDYDEWSNNILDMEKGSCMAEIEMVSIKDPRPNIPWMYYPTCVPVKRCKGCCLGNRRCHPIKTHRKSFKIMKMKKGFSIKSYEVTVEEHLKCNCSCQISEEECSFPNAEYDSMMCTCGCNAIAERKCRMKNTTHIWDSRICSCFCKDAYDCSSGRVWDDEICRCSRYDD